MNVINSTTPALDTLIESCKTYLNLLNHKSRPTAFIEWVIQVADGQGNPSDERIKSKFLSARIWGNDALLLEIQNQLNQIINPVPEPIPTQFVESIASVNDYTVIVSATNDSQLYHPVFTIGKCYVIVNLSRSHSNNYDQINKRLHTLDIITARKVADILCDVLEFNHQIFDHVPKNDLISLGIGTMTNLHLWKGSDGILISSLGNRSTYIGRLTKDCRGIIGSVSSGTHLMLHNTEDRNRTRYTNLLVTHTDNFDNYSRLVQLVKDNVSNPDDFEQDPNTKIKYSVLIDELDSQQLIRDNDKCHPFDLGYGNYLIVTPRINDNDRFVAIMNEVKKTYQSYGVLIKKAEEILNA